MMNECLNMIGGDCISEWHMVAFILAILICGLVGGYMIKGVIDQIKRDGAGV